MPFNLRTDNCSIYSMPACHFNWQKICQRVISLAFFLTLTKLSYCNESLVAGIEDSVVFGTSSGN